MRRAAQAEALAVPHETSNIPRGIVIPRVLFVVRFAFAQAAILDFATCVAIASISAGDRQS